MFLKSNDKLKDFLALLILGIVIFFYFERLFYPYQSFFMIPGVDLNGTWQSDIPLKYFLADSLKNNHFPLWNPHNGNGFPILADGQIGTFYLPNLLLFRFLPFFYAYNFNLVIAFFLMGSGVYFLLRKIKISYISALFGALVFSYSGYISTHLNYLNILQGISLIPFIFLLVLKFHQNNKIIYVLSLAFILTQQIFTGQFYIFFITIIGLIIFALGLTIFNKNNRANKPPLMILLYLLLSILLALLLSGIQLLPSLELYKNSGVWEGIRYDDLVKHPFNFRNLWTFIIPFALGNPLKGSYPHNDAINFGYFNENTIYLGVLPIIFSIFSLYYLKNKLVKINLIILITSILLALGKNSPLYFLFTFPGFNLFPLPSRYLILTILSITILSSFMAERILDVLKFKIRHFSTNLFGLIFICAVVTIFLMDEFQFSYKYPSVVPEKDLLSIPQSANLLTKSDGKIFILDSDFHHLYSVNEFNISEQSSIPKRFSYIFTLADNFTVDDKKQNASLSAIAKNVLSVNAVDYILSPYKIDDTDLTEITVLKTDETLGLNNFYLYGNKNALPRFFLSSNTKLIHTFEEAIREYSDITYLDKDYILIENVNYLIKNQNIIKSEVELLTDENEKIVIKTSGSQDSILILVDNNYPGWFADIDGKKSDIFNVNINQRGIILPKGKHLVTYEFKSRSFEIGKLITIIAMIISFLGVFLSRVSFPGKDSDNKKI